MRRLKTNPIGSKRQAADRMYPCLFVAAAHRDCNGVLLMASLGNPVAHFAMNNNWM
jgi:hypothetical protein